ncbi:MAG: enoyl-CoA hydratase-related protein [Dehalococcoidia bacterium]|jgi:naphthoate synthase/2-ketocyclohexanecarboxyl-CoA hydrolase|nr:enoyl-CoA hydratase-related protein [Dehalococcoidia bacterium]MDP6783137.1 enoyl-CoA hydratase-related protein [Dehalococcoidia bacterium]
MAWTNWEKVAGDGLDFTDLIYEKKYHTEYEGGQARVLVNRADKYNAFTGHTMDEMFRAFYDASHDPMIGLVVLSGVGDHFGTGGDVEWEQWGLREQFYWRSAPNRVVRTCRKPVVAAVKGFCIGGSHHLAYCCDFTIAADTAIFGQNGPRISSPADGFIMPYLVRVVGAKKAREIWMLCRRYTASEALAMGLCNTVVPLDRLEDEVDQWASEMLTLSPGCLEVLKASYDWELDTMPQLGNIANWLHPDYFDTPEGKEGATAFMEKREPQFWKIRKAEADVRKKAMEMMEKGEG